MERQGEWVRMELRDLIRMNRLVRGGIDHRGFVDWYRGLDEPEQLHLIHILVQYACQAGIHQVLYDEAMRLGGIDPSAPLAAKAASFWKRDWTWPDYAGLRKWLSELDEGSREQMLTWAVLLFGAAEGSVYRSEKPEWCNHWWHRDLTDDRVVEDLLNDPQFFRTSMKDDARIKGS